jgi:pyridoxal phosphate-dependent aminotransferase EpsN
MHLCIFYGIPVVADAAEALGATYNGAFAGNFGVMGIFTFNGNKIITTSGGGMLVSDNQEDIKRAKFHCTQARDSALHYQHSHVGYNYRLSNLLAAIGRGQLERLDEKLARKRAINEFYRKAMGNLPGIEFMPEAPYGRSGRWLTVILITPQEFGADREKVRLSLEAENIEALPVWKPVQMQPVFEGCRVRGGKVSKDLFARGLCLPSGTQMTEEDLNRVVKVIRS